MKIYVLLIFVGILYFLGNILPSAKCATTSFPEADELSLEEYIDADLERILYGGAMQKRGCVARGGNCDHMPNDCCTNTTCRCNLWGANCRCQRKGLFQKWGK